MDGEDRVMADAEVSRRIDARPHAVYAVISDLPRMGEWSDENVGGTWRNGGGPAVGAVFVGTNQRGGRRWRTRCRITDAAPGRRFAFEVSSAGMRIARWEYVLEETDGGTLVTERWTDRRSPLVAWLGTALSGSAHDADDARATMEATLRRLADAFTRV